MKFRHCLGSILCTRTERDILDGVFAKGKVISKAHPE